MLIGTAAAQSVIMFADQIGVLWRYGFLRVPVLTTTSCKTGQSSTALFPASAEAS